MRLDKIIRDSGCTVVKGCSHIDVTAICDDSRKVGHGSLFTAVKGFAVGTGMSAFGVTSFETLAYNTDKACLAVIDAGRGNYYACGFNKNKQIDIEPCFINESKILELCKNREIISCDNLPFSHIKADAAVGYNRAIEDKLKKNNMEKVSAFYLKKSQAEEEKK